MESYSWVLEGPSPLKETQTVKKMFKLKHGFFFALMYIAH